MRDNRKVSLKFIKNFPAVEMKNMTWDEREKIRHTHRLDKVFYSMGVYGQNGGIFKDVETGEYFKVTARNSYWL